MKKLIAMICVVAMMATTAFAVSPQNYSSARAAELKSELAAAEDILGAPCKLESEETRVEGDYIVESRLYVVDGPTTRGSSGEVGGVSSEMWRPRWQSQWTIKVMLSGFFYYNGTTAICIKEDAEIWAADPDNNVLNNNLNEDFTYKDGATAKVSCSYAIAVGGEPAISGTLNVTCTGAGSVGIVSGKEHPY